MWDYNRINKQKISLCAIEGITSDREDEFRDMGDDSPLFRYDIQFYLLVSCHWTVFFPATRSDTHKTEGDIYRTTDFYITDSYNIRCRCEATYEWVWAMYSPFE